MAWEPSALTTRPLLQRSFTSQWFEVTFPLTLVYFLSKYFPSTINILPYEQMKTKVVNKTNTKHFCGFSPENTSTDSIIFDFASSIIIYMSLCCVTLSNTNQRNILLP